MSIPDIPTIPEVTGTSKSGLNYHIRGTVQQVVSVDLQPNQVVFSDTGAMSWMTSTVTMNTHSGGGPPIHRGLMKHADRRTQGWVGHASEQIHVSVRITHCLLAKIGVRRVHQPARFVPSQDRDLKIEAIGALEIPLGKVGKHSISYHPAVQLKHDPVSGLVTVARLFGGSSAREKRMEKGGNARLKPPANQRRATRGA